MPQALPEGPRADSALGVDHPPGGSVGAYWCPRRSCRRSPRSRSGRSGNESRPSPFALRQPFLAAAARTDESVEPAELLQVPATCLVIREPLGQLQYGLRPGKLTRPDTTSWGRGSQVTTAFERTPLRGGGDDAVRGDEAPAHPGGRRSGCHPPIRPITRPMGPRSGAMTRSSNRIHPGGWSTPGDRSTTPSWRPSPRAA